MPARDVHQHREIGAQRALRRSDCATLSESVESANLGLGGDYGRCRQACLSTNCNSPSDTDDATITLSVRTPYIASESDTSLQAVRSTGKSVSLPVFVQFRANMGLA